MLIFNILDLFHNFRLQSYNIFLLDFVLLYNKLLNYKEHINMQELTLTTPSLLFSAVSLILLAYTNRFISYASLVRTLKEKHQQTHDPKNVAQIANLRKRLYLTRSMQILGLLSLLFCVVSMFFIYISWQIIAAWIFGIGLLLLAASLCVCIWEINISVNALEIHLQDMSSK